MKILNFQKRHRHRFFRVWQCPKRIEEKIFQRFQLGDTVGIRMKANHHSKWPESVIHSVLMFIMFFS